MRGLVLGFVLPWLACAAGCRVYDPALVGRVDAGADASLVSRQPPPRPSGEDTGGPDTYYFGAREVVMAQGEDWEMYGYDVDDIVTRPPQTDGDCVPPAGGRAPIDGEGGVDNVFGQRFFPLVALTTPDLEQSSREAQEAGKGLPILRIAGWNGLPDDPRVDVAVMQAVFGMPGGEETEPPPPPADPGAVRPAWDGRDWFWVRDDAFFKGDPAQPLIRDSNAYVAGDVLVVRLPSRVDIVFPSDEYGVLVRLTDAVVTAEIADDRREMSNIVVSGRWSIVDLLSTARNIGVCPGSRDYELLLGQLNAIADVRSEPGTGAPDVECDAISLGVGFRRGTRLRVAGLAPGPALADLCAMPRDGGTPDGGTMSEDAGRDAGLDAAADLDAGRDAGLDAAAGLDAGRFDVGLDGASRRSDATAG